jgi:hypothetical protein
MLPLPPVVAWTLAAVGAVVMVKLLSREWQRVNAELDRARPMRMTDPERATMPRLQRDPATGVYRPYR